MTILVIAEHNNETVLQASLNCVAAASKIGGNISILIAGSKCAAAANAAAKIAGVSSVLMADSNEYAHGLAENIAPLIAGMASDYSHILAPATTYGKNIMPRVAALIDTVQISDIVEVVDASTFQRPI